MEEEKAIEREKERMMKLVKTLPCYIVYPVTIVLLLLVSTVVVSVTGNWETLWLSVAVAAWAVMVIWATRDTYQKVLDTGDVEKYGHDEHAVHERIKFHLPVYFPKKRRSGYTAG